MHQFYLVISMAAIYLIASPNSSTILGSWTHGNDIQFDTIPGLIIGFDAHTFISCPFSWHVDAISMLTWASVITQLKKNSNQRVLQLCTKGMALSDTLDPCMPRILKIYCKSYQWNIYLCMEIKSNCLICLTNTHNPTRNSTTMVKKQAKLM